MIKVGHCVELVSGRVGVVTDIVQGARGAKYVVRITRGVHLLRDIGDTVTVYNDLIIQQYTMLDQYLLFGEV